MYGDFKESKKRDDFGRGNKAFGTTEVAYSDGLYSNKLRVREEEVF